MGKILLIFLVLCNCLAANAGDPADSSTVFKIVSEGNSKIVTTIKGQSKEITDSVKAFIKPFNPGVDKLKPSPFLSSLLSFFPIILFLLIVAVVMIKLRRDNINLGDFLVDKEQQVALKKEQTKVSVADAKAKEALVNSPAANADVLKAAVVAGSTQATPAVSDAEPPQSTSRLIVFLTGITSLSIAVCLTSFYLYRWSIGDQNISFTNLSPILYGLGLGILPYGFTKVASVLK